VCEYRLCDNLTVRAFMKTSTLCSMGHFHEGFLQGADTELLLHLKAALVSTYFLYEEFIFAILHIFEDFYTQLASRPESSQIL
jgi:hypothetical protein